MPTETLPTKLYSRYEDGTRPVQVIAPGPGHLLFQVQGEDGLVTEYPSARQLLIGLTGHPQARHWTLDRYFRQGKHRPWDLRIADLPGNQPSLNILDLPFGQSTEGLSVDNGIRGLTIDNGMATPALILSSKSLTIEYQQFGIDLMKRGHEVAKLFYAGFASKLMGAGLDPDDVLQEVYRGILVRNKGKCPWDPHKSSFGHYVHMVANCVISNYFRHENRKNSMEQTGIRGRIVSEGMVDVASDNAVVGLCPTVSGGGEDAVALQDLLKYVMGHGGHEARVHTDVLLMMLQGYNRIEVAKRTELSSATISRLFKTFQGLVLKWDADSISRHI